MLSRLKRHLSTAHFKEELLARYCRGGGGDGGGGLTAAVSQCPICQMSFGGRYKSAGKLRTHMAYHLGVIHRKVDGFSAAAPVASVEPPPLSEETRRLLRKAEADKQTSRQLNSFPTTDAASMLSEKARELFQKSVITPELPERESPPPSPTPVQTPEAKPDASVSKVATKVGDAKRVHKPKLSFDAAPDATPIDALLCGATLEQISSAAVFWKANSSDARPASRAYPRRRWAAAM